MTESAQSMYSLLHQDVITVVFTVSMCLTWKLSYSLTMYRDSCGTGDSMGE